MERMQKIRFNGLDFILPDPDGTDSPIATLDAYKKGECSYAHLHRKNSKSIDAGKIMQFGQQIGVIDDIEFGDFIEIEIDNSEFIEGLLGNTWPI